MASFEEIQPVSAGKTEEKESVYESVSGHESDDDSPDDYNLSLEKRYPKILALCCQVWPSADRIMSIGYTEGGWNRVYPVTIFEDGNFSRYVLRIPQRPFDVRETVTIHKYIEQRNTQIPIPEVIAYDVSHHNPLRYPYTILEHVSEKDVDYLYESLTQSQKVSVAKKLGDIYRQFFAVTNPCSGLLREPEDQKAHPSEPWLMPFGIKTTWQPRIDPRVDDMRDPLLTAETLSTEPQNLSSKDVLLLAFKRRWFYYTILGYEQERQIVEEAISVINDIASDGLLDDHDICLWHADLFPRNIMVDHLTNPDEPAITGIIDWDEAGFAPQFVACRPPDWLWDPEYMYDDYSEYDDMSEDNSALFTDDERLEPLQPKSAEAVEIKTAFECAAGEAYCSRAYDSRFIVARRLLRHCLYPQWDDRVMGKFEKVFEHWRGIKNAYSPGIQPGQDT